MKKTLILAVMLFAVSGCSGQNSSENAAPVNVKSLAGDTTVPITQPATELALYPQKGHALARNYAQQPPLIPHKADYPITLKRNTCLSCHAWGKAERMHATAIPKSHVIDDNGTLNGRNYSCNQCHVPQASNKQAIVGNSFSQ
ncbi:nitrate reductase cytochrome c-type subunit [Shewanella sp.]|uniref:nitrate reductase cytochrome c-type subunit n=1 Tax=Shewanella sp. TaxID=50422 RepID=UPI003A97FBFE